MTLALATHRTCSPAFEDGRGRVDAALLAKHSSREGSAAGLWQSASVLMSLNDPLVPH